MSPIRLRLLAAKTRRIGLIERVFTRFYVSSVYITVFWGTIRDFEEGKWCMKARGETSCSSGVAALWMLVIRKFTMRL